jgi:thiol:disulfide interchange protein DsbD
MGSALGFSLAQPSGVAMLIFTFLGLGMAAPYVLLSAFPPLLKFLPKPGRWMESFKQVLGFILLGTVIWLVWVLGIQAGPTAVTVLLGAMLLIAIGAWVQGRWGTIAAAARTRVTAYIVAAVAIIGGITIGLVGVSGTAAPVASGTHSESGIAWEPYSATRVNELLGNGKAVFIDFTAAWCLSCQVNKQVALNSDEVARKFEKLGVTTVEADWTSRDENITRALAEFGRNSVPLYVLYAPGKSNQPIILPEILTPGIVLDALDRIEHL